MFRKLIFHNLRCFKEFTLDNMGPLTLISGRNNVGKTTLLEGMFLLLTHRNVNVFFNINSFRGIESFPPTPQGLLSGLEPPYLWELLFTDMDISQKLSISLDDDTGQTRTLNLVKDEQTSLTTFPEPSKIQSMLPVQPNLSGYGLKLEYKYGDNPEEIGKFWIAQPGVLTLSFNASLHSSPQIPFCSYISPNMHLSQQIVAEWIGKIELKNQKEQLVKHLSLLFDEIADIFTVSRHGAINIFSRLQTGQTLPIRAMGDGINKLLHYLSAMIANPGGIFLLDEIEAGFHYSFYEKLWEIVANVAKETNSQVIATTHSYECIDAAAKGTAKVDASLLTYIRLGKEDNRVIPYHFSKDDLPFVLERKMEVR